MPFFLTVQNQVNWTQSVPKQRIKDGYKSHKNCNYIYIHIIFFFREKKNKIVTLQALRSVVRFWPSSLYLQFLD